MNVVRKTLIKLDGSRKAEIFERADGTFGFEEFAFAIQEGAWIPHGRYSVAIIDSFDHAVSEATDRIAWLSDEGEQIVGRERRGFGGMKDEG
ncbi:MAG TPA: hypothetical protein VJS64_06530 [Pyrinomonadaceae bacterium]|nr:hypothetical protein [Pyrinomonadaceae bacterium]